MTGGGLSRWPPLGSGSGGTDSGLAKRVDLVTDTVCYVGDAEEGSIEGDAVWRIKRITQTPNVQLGDNIVIDWAETSAAFDKVWADRLTYTYG